MRKMWLIIMVAAVFGFVSSCSRDSQKAELAVKEFDAFVQDVERQTHINLTVIDKILSDNAAWERKYSALPESAFSPEQRTKLVELLRRYMNKMMMLSAIQLDELAEQIDTATATVAGGGKDR